MTEQIISNSRFALGKKWFWIGITVSFFNVVAGIVYGAALAVEKDYRKEGLIVIGWAVAWALIGFFLIGPWLVKSGTLPRFKIIQ